VGRIGKIVIGIMVAGSAAALVALLVARIFFINFYRIPQNGMFPGLPAGSRLFVNKRAYSVPSDVKRGDIVIFRREENGRRYNYIWRVVGLPGERIETSGRTLTINGQAVQQEPLRDLDGKTVYREEIGSTAYEVAFDAAQKNRPPDVAVTVPPDHFFVLGDNRLNARDSRMFGPIPFSTILGRKM
jgi:signal peptidase I